MGTYFTHGATRADIIREILTESIGTTATGTDRRVLRHTAVGNVLWTLHETVYSGEVPEGRLRTERWIGCFLLVRSRDGWGYKPMDESMGPIYLTCPLSYLDAATEPVNAWAREWREKVRAEVAATRTALALTPGTRISVPGARPSDFTLVTLRPIRARALDGRVYRLSRAQLRRAVVVA